MSRLELQLSKDVPSLWVGGRWGFCLNVPDRILLHSPTDMWSNTESDKYPLKELKVAQGDLAPDL